MLVFLLSMACGDGDPQDVPEAEYERCVLTGSMCPEGCGSIEGRIHYPARGCRDGSSTVVGCYPRGASSTLDLSCARSPEGWAVGVAGSFAAQLIVRQGFVSCDGLGLVRPQICPE